MTIYRPNPNRNYIKAFSTLPIEGKGAWNGNTYSGEQTFTLHLGTKDGVEVDVLSICLDGDCCSHSYFDPPLELEHLVGQDSCPLRR